MAFTLPDLPYAHDALAALGMSKETMEYHHDIHHKAYVDNGNKLIAAVEKVISPLCKHIGFRTDLSLNTVLEGTSLLVARKEKVNPMRFWYLVECVNQKDGVIQLASN